MLGHYDFASFVPYDQLICHRYIEVHAGARRFRLQLEPRDETTVHRPASSKITSGSKMEVTCWHDSTILDPFLPTISAIDLEPALPIRLSAARLDAA